MAEIQQRIPNWLQVCRAAWCDASRICALPHHDIYVSIIWTYAAAQEFA
jgi:hypothetical protein